MKPLYLTEPIFINNSKVPVILSKISPVEIYAVNIWFLVFCREEIKPRSKVHETIHWQQQLELLFVFMWFLYALFYLIALAKYKDKAIAYEKNLFEQEAHARDDDLDYLYKRKAYAWWLDHKI
jgi:hypothetical protein